MIKHIVAVKLKEKSKINELTDLFIGLKNEIKVIEKIECEANIYLKRETNYDVMFNIYFATIEEMESYLVNDEHVKVANRLKSEFAENLAIIDVEC